MSAQPLPATFADAAPLTYAAAPARSTQDLVRRHAALVRRIAWHVHGAGNGIVDVEDLVQVGLVALIESAAAPDERGDAAFHQYLSTRLRGAMLDELRRHASATRGAMRRRRQYQCAAGAIMQETGARPDDVVVAARLGVSVEKLRTEYATEPVRHEPLDAIYADDLAWFADATPGAFDQLADAELRDALIAAIAALPEREAQVIQLYHVEELNLDEIGLVLGVSSARVCQIKAAAHGRLRKAMAARR